MPASPIHLFDPISGDLLPTCREQYVQGQLSADYIQPVEAYLAASLIQTNVVLGRAQALLTAAQAEGRLYTPPPWVQERLRYQPTASGAGPLRRPVVRLALGLLLLLVVASGVQWLRNEPLLPAPVARVVAQATNSAVQATHHLVQQLTAPSAPVVAVPASTPVRPTPHVRPSLAHQLAPLAPIEARVAQVAIAGSPPADSMAALTDTAAAPGLPEAPASTLVRGRITDNQGRPLPGATVLVQGTRQAISTDATGDYQLTVPLNSSLQFGYGGYADHVQRYTGASTLNVMLQPTGSGGHQRK